MSPVKMHIAKFWALQLIAWAAYALVSFTGALPYVRSVPHLDSVRSLLANRLAFIAVGICGTGLLRSLYRSDRWQKASLLHTGLMAASSSYLLGLCATAAGNLARWSTGGLYLGGWAIFGGAVSASAVFMAWNACYLAVRAHYRMEQERENALLADAKAQEAQLAALRGQLSPHFLFNALNSIQALIGEEPCRAQFAVEKLASLLRCSLRQSTGGKTRLSEELDSIRQYLSLEKIRFEDNLLVKTEIEPQTESMAIPGFLLQPLVENAVKHGMQTSEMPLQLTIRAGLEGSSLCIEVANSGKWREGETLLGDDPNRGIGLRLVRDRLELSYPGRHRFERCSEDGRVTQRIEIQNMIKEVFDAPLRFIS